MQCYPITENDTKRKISMDSFRKKLGIASVGKLYGRESEESLLASAYWRFQKERTKKLIVITGRSGSGKTALVEHGLLPTIARSRGFFVSAKFEEGFVDQYYSVFIVALKQYVEQFLTVSDEGVMAATKQELLAAVGNEARLLTDLVPVLKQLVGEPSKGVSKMYGLDAQNRIRHLFCRTFRVLSANAPLVLFFDDVQWASAASCDLIRSLLITEGISILIITACMTSREHGLYYGATVVSAGDDNEYGVAISKPYTNIVPFKVIVSRLEKEASVDVEKLTVSALSLDSVSEFLADLMSRDERIVRPLSEILIARTEGTAFHVMQLVRLLIERGTIYKNIEYDRWEWDKEALASNLSPADFFSYLREIIDNLPRVVQEVLKVASCMGDEIDDSAIDIILQTPTGSHLKLAADRGLLLFYPQCGGYRFANTWIRQSVFDLIPKDEREEYFLKIGRKLWKSSSPVALQKNVSVVVALLNKGSSLLRDERERIRFAELNLVAGEKAKAATSYASASAFFCKGIQLMGSGERMWEEHYETMLALYNGASEVEAVNGNYGAVVEYIEEVIRFGRSIDDKLPAYTAFIKSMAEQDNLQEAVRVGCDIMAQLGEKINAENTSSFAMTREVMMSKFAVRGKSNTDILNLPCVRDAVSSDLLQLLCLIFSVCYRSSNGAMVVTACRALRLVMRSGLDDSACIAFAHYAQVMCGLGDTETGIRFGDLALTLAEQMQSKHHLSQVQLILGVHVVHWGKGVGDIESIVDMLRYSIQSALKVGFIETASQATAWRVCFAIILGESLDDLAIEIDRCLHLVRQHQKESTARLCLMIQQFIQCIRGNAKNPARLRGEALIFEQALSDCLATSNLLWATGLRYLAACLAYIFRDMEHANTMLTDMNLRPNSPKSSFVFKELTFQRALVAVELAKAGTEARKNTKVAQSVLKQITPWMATSPGVLCKKLFLEAELAVLVREVNTKQVNVDEDIVGLYLAASSAAEAQGNLHQDGIILERLADYFVACRDDDRAVAMYERASNLFSDWGAYAKVEQLRHIIEKVSVQCKH